MPQQLIAAAVQMDATVAPTTERLVRATRLVEQAATDGAQIIVLPELFNLGYRYDDDNFARAESLDGPTLAWMRSTAVRLGVHLAGSLLLRDGDDFYNALCLLAPNGRMWRYNKRYPWAWERHYFRPGCGAVVAETDLGRVGMLVCWDSSHAHLWRSYAGSVELMIVSSCPPDAGDAHYHLPNGIDFTLEQISPIFAAIRQSARQTFGTMINEQASWLGVPTICTVGTGQVTTPVPGGVALFALWGAIAPKLWRLLPLAGRLQATYMMTSGTKIIDAGRVLQEMEQGAGEDYILATVTIPDEPPQPVRPQPPSPVHWLAYVTSDFLIPALMAPRYRTAIKRMSGKQDALLPWQQIGAAGMLALLVAIALRVLRKANRV